MSSPSLNPGRCSSAPTRRCPDTVRAEPRRHQAQLPGRGAGACPQRTGKVKQGQTRGCFSQVPWPSTETLPYTVVYLRIAFKYLKYIYSIP